MIYIQLFAVEIMAVEARPTNHIDFFSNHSHFLRIFILDRELLFIAEEIEAGKVISGEDQDLIGVDGSQGENLLPNG